MFDFFIDLLYNQSQVKTCFATEQCLRFTYKYNKLRKGIKMDITEVKVKLVNKEDSRVKAIASMTIDGCFVVHDIRVIQKEDGYNVNMPNRKNLSGKFTDIVHPINSETRELVNKTVIEAYEKAKAEAEQA